MALQPVPSYTPLGTPPSRADPANFASRGDTFMSALPTLQTDINNIANNVHNNATEALGSANSASTAQGLAEGARDASIVAKDASVTAQGLAEGARDASIVAKDASVTAQGLAEGAAAAMYGTSITSATISTGSKTFAVQAGKRFDTGNFVILSSDANPANYLHGQITAYSGSNLTVNVIDVGGSGTAADWSIHVSGTQGGKGDKGNPGLAGAVHWADRVAGFTALNAATETVFNCTGTFTISFESAAGLGEGWYCYVKNAGSGVITLDPNLAETIDGLASITARVGDTYLVQCTGVDFNTVRVAGDGSKNYSVAHDTTVKVARNAVTGAVSILPAGFGCLYSTDGGATKTQLGTAGFTADVLGDVDLYGWDIIGAPNLANPPSSIPIAAYGACFTSAGDYIHAYSAGLTKYSGVSTTVLQTNNTYQAYGVTGFGNSLITTDRLTDALITFPTGDLTETVTSTPFNLMELMPASALSTDGTDLYSTHVPYGATLVNYSSVFSADGLNLYVVNYSSSVVTQYALSVAYDITTMYPVATHRFIEEASLRGITFNNTGTKVYTVGITSGTVFQYSLSTAWDITTATYDSVSVAVGVANPLEVAFSSDGLTMFVGITNVVYSGVLTTAWDITTFVATDWQAYPSTAANSFSFNSTGTKLVVATDTDNNIHQYSLSTPWDLTTTTYIGALAAGINPSAIAGTPSLDTFFIFSTAGGAYEYSMPTDILTATSVGLVFSLSRLYLLKHNGVTGTIVDGMPVGGYTSNADLGVLEYTGLTGTFFLSTYAYNKLLIIDFTTKSVTTPYDFASAGISSIGQYPCVRNPVDGAFHSRVVKTGIVTGIYPLTGPFGAIVWGG